jgi:hypothetical protein
MATLDRGEKPVLGERETDCSPNIEGVECSPGFSDDVGLDYLF